MKFRQTKRRQRASAPDDERAAFVQQLAVGAEQLQQAEQERLEVPVDLRPAPGGTAAPPHPPGGPPGGRRQLVGERRPAVAGAPRRHLGEHLQHEQHHLVAATRSAKQNGNLIAI